MDVMREYNARKKVLTYQISNLKNEKVKLEEGMRNYVNPDNLNFLRIRSETVDEMITVLKHEMKELDEFLEGIR